MKKRCVSYDPGDIVQLAGIKFVVLEDQSPKYPSSGDRSLLILALDGQGTSRFGETNNYVDSDLRKATEKWLTEKLYDHGCNPEYIKSRKLDLTTMDGYKGFGELYVKAAPLTLDEARRCAELIPDPDIAFWMATGWGGPEHDTAHVLRVYTDGGWSGYNCSLDGAAIRPALVVSSFVFDSDDPDLRNVTTEAMLDELRRRIEE